jgi:protein-tyrosine-phosphatase
MKVLFVCRANVIRSQMAEAWYNLLTGTKDAESAGTIVDVPGETLGDRRPAHPAGGLAVDVMQEKRIDISSAIRTQVTPEMLPHYDAVINMAAPQYTPDWLAAAPNYIFWDISDPLGEGYERTAATRDIVEQKVKELIASSKA